MPRAGWAIAARPAGRAYPRVVALALAAVLALALATAQRALAHAELVETRPAAGATLPRQPGQVELRFNETVGAPRDAIRLLDASGAEVGGVTVEALAGHRIVARPGGPLPDGVYTVAWHVVSADSHPISGAYAFRIGPPGAVAPVRAAAPDAPEAVHAAFGVVRAIDLGLILLVAGGAACLALVLRGAAAGARSRVASALGIGALALIPVALAGIVLQSATLAAGGLGAGMRAAALRDAVDGTFGPPWIARIWLGAAAGVFLLAAARAARPERPAAIAAVLAAPLVLLPGLASHARAAGGLDVVVDVAHVAGAAVWVGGLAALAVALVAAGPGRAALARAAVPRFSAIALGAVILLAAAGTIAAFRRIGSWGDLAGDGYGRLVLAKIALLAVLIGIGAVHRTVGIPRLRAGGPLRSFGRLVGAELALMAVVVALTAVLVAEPPPAARADAATAVAGPVDIRTGIGPNRLHLTVAPGTVGTNRIDLRLEDPRGRRLVPREVRLTASLPERQIGRIDLAAELHPGGHVVVPPAEMFLPGSWRFQVTVRLGAFESLTRTVTVPIREEH
jgi:copper transport protein